jgi:hypothetical protein
MLKTKKETFTLIIFRLIAAAVKAVSGQTPTRWNTRGAKYKTTGLPENCWRNTKPKASNIVSARFPKAQQAEDCLI